MIEVVLRFLLNKQLWSDLKRAFRHYLVDYVTVILVELHAVSKT